jgi:TRAP-type C4-dicarboxylate transport system permease small subunit
MAEENREILVLNVILILFALGSLGIGVWTVFSDGFKAGTDDLFLLMVCLLLALLFSVGPILWAYNKGLIKNPFKRKKAAGDDKASAPAR